jgi:hypothetical protein
MIPTLAGFAILIALAHARSLQLFALAIGLTLQWLWDLRAPLRTAWFARLRTILTVGAVAGLLGGVIAIG